MHPIMILKFQYSNSKAYIGFSEERPYKHYMWGNMNCFVEFPALFEGLFPRLVLSSALRSWVLSSTAAWHDYDAVFEKPSPV